jgi:tyrosyl-tRNA synthetase
MRLGRELVSVFHGREQAEAVEQEFVRVFQKKGVPDEMPEFCLKDLGLTARPEIVSLLVAVGFAPSRGEARRLLEQGGVRLNDVKLDPRTEAEVRDGDILKVGKRKFGRLLL